MDRIILACAGIIATTCLAQSVEPELDMVDEATDVIASVDDASVSPDGAMDFEASEPWIDDTSTPRTPPPHLPTAAEFVHLIDDLRSDDVRGNMLEAVQTLSDPRLMPSLLDELPRARDIQQRDGILVAIVGAAAKGAWMPPEVFDDVFELLDATSYNRRTMLGQYGNPWGGSLKTVVMAFSAQTRYASARGELVDRFHHGDPRQQFLCAFVLARTGCVELLDELLAYWKPHLEDNAIDQDGSWARRAITGLGAPALPTLRAWRSGSDDDQLSRYVDLVVMAIVSHDDDPWAHYDCRGVPELAPGPWRVVAALHGQPAWKPPVPTALLAHGWKPGYRGFDDDVLTSSPDAADGDDTPPEADPPGQDPPAATGPG